VVLENDLKILIVTPVYPFPEYRDGTRKILTNILRYLALTFQFDILTFYQSEDEPFFFHEDKYPVTYYKIFQRPLTKLIALLRWSISRYPFNPNKYATKYHSVATNLNQNGHQYDVIHFATPFLAPVIGLLKPNLQKKTILFPHDAMSLLTQRRLQWESSWLTKRSLLLDYRKTVAFEKKYYPLAQKTVFVSEVDASFIQNLNSNIKVSWISNGVDTGYFQPQESDVEKNSIIFTGNLDYAPNADAAIFLTELLFPLLKRKLPGIKLYVVGNHPQERLLKHHNGKDIIITGFVNDLREYLAKAALFLSPLRYGSGLKNKILEAMAMEKAVVGSPVSLEGISGLEQQKNMLIMDGLNPEQWVETISRMLPDNNTLKRIGKEARQLMVEQYSWDKICQSYQRLYEDCAAH
jgi:glycosyltransferase involved in cell wall biosynthesis